MLVVADRSPLNYLVGIGLAEVLRWLHGSVVIPLEVRNELLSDDAPSRVKTWASDLPDWVEVSSPDPAMLDDPRWNSLDLGERAALALSVSRDVALLLIDERAGSAIARACGIPVTGTLGVLDEAARRNLISLPDAIQRLKQTSFRYPKKIVERLLDEDAKRRR